MKRIVVLACLGLSLMLAGCYREYNEQKYEDVESNESAFVIPLDIDSDKQIQIRSIEELEKAKVVAKRIPIPRRWHSTGRMYADGKWIPEVRIIKINRSPVTRTWTASKESGTAAKDQAIWVESRDSVGFSTGITCTAKIEEKDTALYLYKYNANQLTEVMDTEIRAYIQQAWADQAAKYDLDVLRTKKSEIITAVREEVVQFYKTSGITITTLGMVGGLTYENKDIQTAIDKTVQDQQRKVSAVALQEAAKIENETMLAKQKAAADAKILEAKGEGESRLIAAEAESEAKKAIAEAQSVVITKVGGIQGYLSLLSLDVQKEQVMKWNGSFPQWMMGGQTPGMLFQIPVPEQKVEK